MERLLLLPCPSCLLNFLPSPPPPRPKFILVRAQVSSRRALCSSEGSFRSCSHSTTFYLPRTQLMEFSTAVLTSSVSPAPLISLAPAFFSAGLFNLFLDH